MARAVQVCKFYPSGVRRGVVVERRKCLIVAGRPTPSPARVRGLPDKDKPVVSRGRRPMSVQRWLNWKYRYWEIERVAE